MIGPLTKKSAKKKRKKNKKKKMGKREGGREGVTAVAKGRGDRGGGTTTRKDKGGSSLTPNFFNSAGPPKDRGQESKPAGVRLCWLLVVGLC